MLAQRRRRHTRRSSVSYIASSRSSRSATKGHDDEPQESTLGGRCGGPGRRSPAGRPAARHRPGRRQRLGRRCPRRARRRRHDHPAAGGRRRSGARRSPAGAGSGATAAVIAARSGTSARPAGASGWRLRRRPSASRRRRCGMPCATVRPSPRWPRPTASTCRSSSTPWSAAAQERIDEVDSPTSTTRRPDRADHRARQRRLPGASATARPRTSTDDSTDDSTVPTTPTTEG